MGILPIHGLYAKRWAVMYSIGRASISIIGWNRIIVASNSGTIPCVALELLKRRHASVVASTNYATISVRAAPWENGSLFQNSDERSSSGWSPLRHYYIQLH